MQYVLASSFNVEQELNLIQSHPELYSEAAHSKKI